MLEIKSKEVDSAFIKGFFWCSQLFLFLVFQDDLVLFDRPLLLLVIWNGIIIFLVNPLLNFSSINSYLSFLDLLLDGFHSESFLISAQMRKLLLIVDVLCDWFIVVFSLWVLLTAGFKESEFSSPLSTWDLLREKVLLTSCEQEILNDISTPEHELSQVSLDVHDVVTLRIGHQDLQEQLKASGLVALQSETEWSASLALGLDHW